MAERLHDPYIADTEMLDSLRIDMSVHSPADESYFKGLEPAVSTRFLSRFGVYITDEQRDSMSQHRMIYMPPQVAETFHTEWSKGVSIFDISDTPIDNIVYTTYSVGTGNSGDETFQEDGVNRIARMHQAGKFGTYPLILDRDEPVDVGRLVLHEKVHTIQDWRLPLPLLEASATYYARIIGESIGGVDSNPSRMDLLADLYAELVETSDKLAHSLVFGTLADETRPEILRYAKTYFSNDRIASLSILGNDPSKHIQWTTVALT